MTHALIIIFAIWLALNIALALGLYFRPFRGVHSRTEHGRTTPQAR